LARPHGRLNAQQVRALNLLRNNPVRCPITMQGKVLQNPFADELEPLLSQVIGKGRCDTGRRLMEQARPANARYERKTS